MNCDHERCERDGCKECCYCGTNLDEVDTGVRYGYMCMIDWQHELGEAMGGNKIYPSLEDLKRNHTMWAECGIVKVRITVKEVIENQNLLGKKDET